tara:strand:+ start:1149 stop:1823 length:675 start_codon:yes stop_codon:yes gene_type:complete
MYFKEPNLVFIHIPKTAGTSIRKALTGHSLFTFLHKDWHLSGEQFLDRSRDRPLDRETKFFSVIRNTYERMVSLYLHTCRGKNKDQAFNFGSFLSEVNNSKHKHTASQLYWISDRIKGACCSWREHKPSCCWCEYNNMGDTFHPSHQYDDTKSDLVFRFEELDTVEKFLQENICKGITLPRLNVNKGSTIHYSEYYTKETRRIVRRMYAQEIDRFNFKFEEPNG